jgi:EAL domain-containing protein (putative c-di-GMP-specific phosphodiesterase class I)
MLIMIDAFADNRQPVTAEFRRPVPRVCIIDNKPHIRGFLAESFEDLGFIADHCARVSDVAAMSRSAMPDLVVLGQLDPPSEIGAAIRTLAAERYPGKLMLFGGRSTMVLLALQELAESLGLTMLPPLLTPFRDSDLQTNLSDFLPIAAPPSVPVDVDEALAKGWLEVWYQPKIELRTMTLRGAEALVRMRHPVWGVVPPACFLPGENDPHLRILTEFVVARAMADWQFFVAGRAPIEMSVNLPLAALEDADTVDRICLQLPDMAAAAGLIVEVSGSEIGRATGVVRDIVQRFKACHIGTAIDDVATGDLWSILSEIPFAEVKVDRRFVDGCARDPLKRAVCGTIVQMASRFGMRSVAEGIESSADFRAVCEMGFELGQGFLFAKPMEPRKFARTMLRRHAGASK